MARQTSFDEPQLREAVRASRSFSETLRRLGLRAAGGNHKTVQKYVVRWGISTAHFDPDAGRRGRRPGRPLDEVLVAHSTYTNRGALKQRLDADGLKRPECELCGQGELWRGKRMSLILDHRNGVADDNRLENLQIVCPNCNATLATHCGKVLRKSRPARACLRCRADFMPATDTQRYCSRACGSRWDRRGRPVPALRRVERPPYPELRALIAMEGYEAVGRRYGVSGTAVRKWRRAYEAAEREGT